MSYTDEQIQNLAIAIKQLKPLINSLNEFNDNINVIERLADAIERSNELKERELGITSSNDARVLGLNNRMGK